MTPDDLVRYLTLHLPPEPAGDRLRQWRPSVLPRCLTEVDGQHYATHGARFWLADHALYVRAPDRQEGVVFGVTVPGGVAIVEGSAHYGAVKHHRDGVGRDPMTGALRMDWFLSAITEAALTLRLPRRERVSAWAKVRLDALGLA